jgi:hypothetical protein
MKLGRIWSLAAFYVPLWIIILIVVILYAILFIQTYRINRLTASSQRIGKAWRKKKKDELSAYTQLICYPAIFVLVWLFPTINRMSQMFVNPIFGLMMIHSLISPLQGFLNCIVYSFNPIEHHDRIRKIIEYLFTSKGKSLKQEILTVSHSALNDLDVPFFEENDENDTTQPK